VFAEVNLVSLYEHWYRRIDTNWGFAFVCWIVSGLYVFVDHHGGSLKSRGWLLFFLAGSLITSPVFGSLAWLVLKTLARLHARRNPWGLDSGPITAVLATEAVGIFLAARWVLRQIL
jgi:hypothetical protein